jgi:hypothetical protein
MTKFPGNQQPALHLRRAQIVADGTPLSNAHDLENPECLDSLPCLLVAQRKVPGNCHIHEGTKIWVKDDDTGTAREYIPPESPAMCLRSMTILDSNDFEKVVGFCNEPLFLNVYFIRSIAFDEQGRAQRTAKSSLSWGRMLVSDVAGIYHVGLEAYGVEYTFGNYHGRNTRCIGGTESGVQAHEPRKAGPCYVLKESIFVGHTRWTSQFVEDTAKELAGTSFTRQSYDKIRNNCVDFSHHLGDALVGSMDTPQWCYRAAYVARMMGAGINKGFESVNFATTRVGEIFAPYIATHRNVDPLEVQTACSGDIGKPSEGDDSIRSL